MTAGCAIVLAESVLQNALPVHVLHQVGQAAASGDAFIWFYNSILLLSAVVLLTFEILGVVALIGAMAVGIWAYDPLYRLQYRKEKARQDRHRQTRLVGQEQAGGAQQLLDDVRLAAANAHAERVPRAPQ
jgi:hypothetical protein